MDLAEEVASWSQRLLKEDTKENFSWKLRNLWQTLIRNIIRKYRQKLLKVPIVLKVTLKLNLLETGYEVTGLLKYYIGGRFFCPTSYLCIDGASLQNHFWFYSPLSFLMIDLGRTEVRYVSLYPLLISLEICYLQRECALVSSRSCITGKSLTFHVKIIWP